MTTGGGASVSHLGEENMTCATDLCFNNFAVANIGDNRVSRVLSAHQPRLHALNKTARQNHNESDVQATENLMDDMVKASV